MHTISSADFQRNLGLYADRALVEPLLVTRNGRDRIVLLAAEEYRRLKSLDRDVRHVSQLSHEELAAIAAAAVPTEFAYLDGELRS